MPKPLINITRRQAYHFAFFLVLYEFLTYIANDMIMPGMIHVVSSFHGHESDIADSLTAYLIGGASLQLILGPLSDRFGRRIVMISGSILFLLCTIGIACSNSMEQFMLGRVLQGMGLCFICVVGYATIQELFTEMDAVRIIAVMANVATIAPLIGPLFGAMIVYYTSWRYIFVGISFLAMIACLGLMKTMPETVGVTRHDGELHQMTFSFRNVVSTYKVLCRNSVFILGCILLGLAGLPCIIWIALSPVLLVNVAHLSIITYALWQIPVFGACILGSLCLQKISKASTTLKALIFKGALLVISGILLMLLLPLCFGQAYYWLLPGIFVYFFGIGFGSSPLTRFILFSTHVMKGTASAVMSMVQMSIQAIGLAGANLLYVSHNNILLASYCLGIGGLCTLALSLMFRISPEPYQNQS